jgi:hypothetical protein
MIDCFRMLAELQEAGLTNVEVARRLGKRPSTIEYWKSDPTHIPRFDNAVRLILLYAEVLGKSEIRVLVSTTTYKLVVTPTM